MKQKNLEKMMQALIAGNKKEENKRRKSKFNYERYMQVDEVDQNKKRR